LRDRHVLHYHGNEDLEGMPYSFFLCANLLQDVSAPVGSMAELPSSI
jgi:hypothetical protein